MPYRRLPDSDAKRLQALQAAADKAEAIAPAYPAFSHHCNVQLQQFLPKLNKEIQEIHERGIAQTDQVKIVGALRISSDRLRLLSRHFLQTIIMGGDRGALDAAQLAFYHLKPGQSHLPSPESDAEVIAEAESILKGEAQRTEAGGIALTFPSATEIHAELEKHRQLLESKAQKDEFLAREAGDIEQLRAEADSLIHDIWDEVEFAFRRESPVNLRSKAREYGVTYAVRPGEEPDPEVLANAENASVGTEVHSTANNPKKELPPLDLGESVAESSHHEVKLAHASAESHESHHAVAAHAESVMGEEHAESVNHGAVAHHASAQDPAFANGSSLTSAEIGKENNDATRVHLEAHLPASEDEFGLQAPPQAIRLQAEVFSADVAKSGEHRPDIGINPFPLTDLETSAAPA